MQNLHQPLQTTMEKNRQKAIINSKIKKTEDSIIKLIDQNIKAENEYAEGDYRRQLLRTMLDLILPLKVVADTIANMQEAMSTLNSTLSIIDDSMNLMEELMAVQDSQRHTMYKRIKSRAMLNKFIRNNRMRMLVVYDKMQSLTTISSQMQASLRKLSLQMQKKQNKQSRRLQKEQNKVSKNKSAYRESFINVSVDNMIKERKKQLELAGNSPKISGDDSPGSAPTKKDNFNIDDII